MVVPVTGGTHGGTRDRVRPILVHMPILVHYAILQWLFGLRSTLESVGGTRGGTRDMWVVPMVEPVTGGTHGGTRDRWYPWWYP
jgi:hypothetical protein